MKKYFDPELDIIGFDVEDVIADGSNKTLGRTDELDFGDIFNKPEIP